MRNDTSTLRGKAGRPTAAGRATVTVCVADPDLAEDCLAAATACGLSPSRSSLVEVGPGTGLVLCDDGAYQSAGPAAASALAAADCAVPVCSDLTPQRPGGRKAVALPSGTPTLIRELQSGGTADLGGRHLAVFGAHGGAGASTFACASALLAARETETVLVEATPSGPGLDLLLGIESAQGMRLGDIRAGSGTIEAEQLRAALPRRGSLAVAAGSAGGRTVAGGRSPAGDDTDAALAVAHAARRGGLLVVSDGGVLAEREALVAGETRELPEPLLRAADGVVLVVRSTLAGMVQALRVLPQAAESGALVVVALRRSRGDALGEGDFLPLLREALPRGGHGEIAELCTFGSERRIAAALDGGEEPRPGRRLAGAIRRAWDAAGIVVAA
ncbi:hypothetical protein [Dietzia sp.]|uniref:hypothetical protein n=1 Tax=Dietzia sp. TaxID=1871616 RepID=UPI002FD9FE7D